ncbi:hypothetical protein B296_00021892 [Ensete ventricosum]|uniref:Uncharacterized protein n=1 Tax=Ensete ventricosum TaxID=4639 RepID=A0A426YKV6_ENSVE|nr:hypothetical protein B296_00021892 [Ensete ventricosum]
MTTSFHRFRSCANFIVDSSPSTVATSASATDGTNEISTDLPTSTDTVAATLTSFLSPEQRNLGRLPSLQPRQRSGTLAPAVSGPTNAPANAALANTPLAAAAHLLSVAVAPLTAAPFTAHPVLDAVPPTPSNDYPLSSSKERSKCGHHRRVSQD